MSGKKVRVIIVDDTRSIRAMIRALLCRSPRIEVIAEAGDPYEARELIRTLNPDVITLDVVMPRMDGLSFLARLMRLKPMPVVMVSTRTTEKSNEAVRALSLGAVDCVDLGSLRDGATTFDLADTVLMASESNTSHFAIEKRAPPAANSAFKWNGRAALIGSSTGGVDALTNVLSSFPTDGPPTVIAQHMPPSFLASFAARLNRAIAPQVLLAAHAQKLEPGHVYLAPGGNTHIALSRNRPLSLDHVPDDGALHVPSVDILMSSGERHGAKVVGVILTGMGKDGAKGLLKMRKAGAHTIVQSSETCVVDGMPKAARNIGAACEIVPLDQIGAQLLKSTSCQEQTAK